MMKIKGGEIELFRLLNHQLTNFFLISDAEKELLKLFFNETLNKVEFNFKNQHNKYYWINDENSGIVLNYFNPYHSAQYTIYLYYYSYIISQHNKVLADKVYYLNKIMNGCDLYHEVKLPDIFSLDHPVGTVIGRAKIGDFFSFGQNCTVGNNKGIYPEIGEHVKMTANTMIIGNCKIGNNVTLGAGSVVKDQDVPNNVNVFGQSPNIIFKAKKNV